MEAAPARLATDLARIAAMDLARLQQRWRRVFGRAAPSGVPRTLLVRALAYRIQAEEFGDLDRATKTALDQMAKGGGVIPMPALPSTKPGTLLVREWQGRMHSVMVLADGFAWNGSSFRSLSEVAHAITGTRWNGPRFFGLRQKSTRAEGRTR
jgi:hypothetical protein